MAPENAVAIASHNWDELRGYRDIAKTGDLTAEKARELIHGYYAAISYTDAQIGKASRCAEKFGGRLKIPSLFCRPIMGFTWANNSFGERQPIMNWLRGCR